MRSFSVLLEKFITLGYTSDIEFDLKSSKDISRLKLYLARAELHRQRTKRHQRCDDYPTNVYFNDLPLGPIGLLEFSINKPLHRYLSGKRIENVCIVCNDPVNIGESVLFTCGCSEVNVNCRTCTLNLIASQLETYTKPFKAKFTHGKERNIVRQSKVLGIQCPCCRSTENFTVTHTEDAILEEKRLTTKTFKRFPELSDKQPNKVGYYRSEDIALCYKLISSEAGSTLLFETEDVDDALISFKRMSIQLEKSLLNELGVK